MKTLTALAIKFIASAIVLYVILGILFNMSIQGIFITTVVIGVISFIIGDLLILPRTNNTVATAIDFGLTFTLIWSIFSFGNVDDNYRTLFWASLVGGLGVALCEYFLHMFLNRSFFSKEESDKESIPSHRFIMETSEELHPESKDKK